MLLAQLHVNRLADDPHPSAVTVLPAVVGGLPRAVGRPAVVWGIR